MKKMILVAVAVLVMVFNNGGHCKEYAKTTIVKEVNYEADEVLCVDFNGEEWAFEGCEDWMVGDCCSMIMNDNGTSEIYDDIIVSCRYTGYFG